MESTMSDRPSGNAPTPGRFGLQPAPGGLRLAQDLVNTSLHANQGKPGPDQLEDLSAASVWLREALGAWSAATGMRAPELSLQSRDLAPLRRLREQLRRSLRANAAHVDQALSLDPSRPDPARTDETRTDETVPDETGPDDAANSDIRLTLDANGQVEYQSLAAGWRGVAALISIELLLAQAAGSRGRLKTCAAPACGACFHDGSPNQARVWHDTKKCGNGPNLRASRARRASTASSG
jgi:hypothetical protein